MGVSRVPERITRPDERFDSSQVGSVYCTANFRWEVLILTCLPPSSLPGDRNVLLPRHVAE